VAGAGRPLRSCDGSISPRYPLTEALTGALFVAVLIARGASRTIWLDLIFVAALVAITRIDLEHRIIPNRILAPLALAAIMLTALFEPQQLPERLLAATAAGGCCSPPRSLTPRDGDGRRQSWPR